MKFERDKTCRIPNWIAGPYRICQSWGLRETHFTASKSGRFIAITRAPKDDETAIAAAKKAAADACREHAGV